MHKKKLTDIEKKQIIQKILGENHSSAGRNFPVFSKLIDGLGNANDILSFAELIPSLNTLVSGPMASSIASNASFLGILMFPFAQLINLVNANQTGHKLYSYRCIVYTITAWSFRRPIPQSSARILKNIRSGAVVQHSDAVNEYNALWQSTSRSVLKQIGQLSTKTGVPKEHIQAIFKALGNNQPESLCTELLKSFESRLTNYAEKMVWKSNYKIRYGE